MEVRGDLSSNVENKESFMSRSSSLQKLCLSISLMIRASNRIIDTKLMFLHYFLQAWWSTRKTLLIFHVARQVSPDFHLFRNFWKEKGCHVSPTHTIKVFGFWQISPFLIIWVCLTIIMHRVRYKCEENRKAWRAHKFLMQLIARSIKFPFEWMVDELCIPYIFL